jgi:hypothetical protein
MTSRSRNSTARRGMRATTKPWAECKVAESSNHFEPLWTPTNTHFRYHGGKSLRLQSTSYAKNVQRFLTMVGKQRPSQNLLQAMRLQKRAHPETHEGRDTSKAPLNTISHLFQKVDVPPQHGSGGRWSPIGRWLRKSVLPMKILVPWAIKNSYQTEQWQEESGGRGAFRH